MQTKTDATPRTTLSLTADLTRGAVNPNEYARRRERVIGKPKLTALIMSILDDAFRHEEGRYPINRDSTGAPPDALSRRDAVDRPK